jgi:hypothetical protein
VAADVGLAINPSVGSPEELLSLVHAQEVAQALLAAAVEKKESLPPEGVWVPSSQSTVVGARAAPSEPVVPNAQVGVAVATPCGSCQDSPREKSDRSSPWAKNQLEENPSPPSTGL